MRTPEQRLRTAAPRSPFYHQPRIRIARKTVATVARLGASRLSATWSYSNLPPGERQCARDDSRSQSLTPVVRIGHHIFNHRVGTTPTCEIRDHDEAARGDQRGALATRHVRPGCSKNDCQRALNSGSGGIGASVEMQMPVKGEQTREVFRLDGPDGHLLVPFRDRCVVSVGFRCRQRRASTTARRLALGCWA